MYFESLDPRRLLNGGVDPSFGGAQGLTLDVPGVQVENIMTSVIDASGRTLLVGSTSPTAAQSSALLVRLTSTGAFDPSFGDNGVIKGTPRGIVRYENLIPLRSGGFLALANRQIEGHFAQPVLVRLRTSGTIDQTFGKKGDKGVVKLPAGLSVGQLVERSDGKIWVVGQKDLHGEGAASLVVVRLLSNGRVDETFAVREIGARGESDLLYGASTRSLHATLTDRDGLALLVNESNSHYSSTDESYTNGNAKISVYRVLPNDSVRSIRLESFTAEAPDRVPSIIFGRLFVTGTDTLQVIYGDTFSVEKLVKIVNVNLITSATQSTDIAPRMGEFDWTGTAVRLLDGTLMLGGGVGAHSGGNAAVLKLNPDLSRDTSFGTNGLLEPVPEQANNVGLVNAVRILSIMADGRIAAYMVGDYGDRTGESYVFAHLFRDDRPVASLVRWRSYENKHRVTVQFRAAKPIDLSTLGNDDLRLADANGKRYALRLLGYEQQGGIIVGTYQIARSSIPNGTFSLRTIAGAVQTVDEDELIARSIGSVRLV
jgi:uncharacterized delta-60 repeat protein